MSRWAAPLNSTNMVNTTSQHVNTTNTAMDSGSDGYWRGHQSQQSNSANPNVQQMMNISGKGNGVVTDRSPGQHSQQPISTNPNVQQMQDPIFFPNTEVVSNHSHMINGNAQQMMNTSGTGISVVSDRTPGHQYQQSNSVNPNVQQTQDSIFIPNTEVLSNHSHMINGNTQQMMNNSGKGKGVVTDRTSGYDADFERMVNEIWDNNSRKQEKPSSTMDVVPNTHIQDSNKESNYQGKAFHHPSNSLDDVKKHQENEHHPIIQNHQKEANLSVKRVLNDVDQGNDRTPKYTRIDTEDGRIITAFFKDDSAEKMLKHSKPVYVNIGNPGMAKEMIGLKKNCQFQATGGKNKVPRQDEEDNSRYMVISFENRKKLNSPFVEYPLTKIDLLINALKELKKEALERGLYKEGKILKAEYPQNTAITAKDFKDTQLPDITGK